MQELKGVIFDLDGVLCHTDMFHLSAWRKALGKYGIAISDSTGNKLRGVSRMSSLEIILQDAGVDMPQERKEEICRVKNDIYVGQLKNLGANDLACDAVSTLLALKENGIKIAVGSSSKNTKTILSALGIEHLFDAVVDGNMITKSKPDPEVFLKAAEALGLRPNQCAVVEDAESGIQAAKAGGFYAIAISDATSSPLADKKIGCLADILG